MKIAMVHGQNHKGTTCHVGRMLAKKLGGEVKEFFLPRDFGEFCVGCTACFMQTEKKCPHYEKLEPLTNALEAADVIILTSPVYVFHSTGPMKAWLDHYGYQWMVHRPNPAMFQKQAVCIATAAGAGMRSACKDMADSLFFWGVPKIYRCKIAAFATSYKGVSDKKKREIDRKTSEIAAKIKRNAGRVRPGILTKGFFWMMRMANKRGGFNPADKEYWKSMGWLGRRRPWRRKANKN
ncbi:MAG: NAD(P)H-dependent oxidoreductase [Roseburia sp.]|nr:NAD(P)H-dependent oxidoreductase [Roseburia sp.]